MHMHTPLRGIMIIELPRFVRLSQRVHVFEAISYEGDPAESEEMRPQWFRVAELPLKVRQMTYNFSLVPLILALLTDLPVSNHHGVFFVFFLHSSSSEWVSRGHPFCFFLSSNWAEMYPFRFFLSSTWAGMYPPNPNKVNCRVLAVVVVVVVGFALTHRQNLAHGHELDSRTRQNEKLQYYEW